MALLEELPNVTMLSRVPIMVAGVPDDIEGMRRAPHVDVCAGWVEGGELALRPPDVLPQRYPFKLETAAEEGAWSELPELPPISFRRFRTIEVQAGTEAGVFEVRSAFSDVVSEPSGKLTLLHSYGVDAVVDAERRLSSCIARPRALPTGDCLGAATSTGRLIGVSLDDVYRRVRHEFRGTTTCTHLNEQLRALADVSHLLDIMAYDS